LDANFFFCDKCVLPKLAKKHQLEKLVVLAVTFTG